MAAFNRRDEGLYLVEVALGIDCVVGECWDEAVAGIEVFNRLVTWVEFLNGNAEERGRYRLVSEFVHL